MYIKIFGERNTGTNYLQLLVTKNLKVNVLKNTVPLRIRKLFWKQSIISEEWLKDFYFRVTEHRNLGWKHRMVPDLMELDESSIDPNDVLFLTLTKNPYSWLMSLKRNPYHAFHRADKIDFMDFLQSSWKPVGREHYSGIYENPMDLWNRKNRGYVDLNDKVPNIVNLKYEDLLRSPFNIVKRIALIIGQSITEEKFKNIKKSAKTNNNAKDFDYYRKYYLNKEWLKGYNQEFLDTVNSTIDKDLMKHFSYEVERFGKVYKQD